MTKIVLRFLDTFQALFKWLGADYEPLRHIVEVKFLIQNRRPMSAFSHYNSGSTADAEHNNSFLRTCGLMAFLGLFAGLFIFIIDVPYYAISMLFGYALMMAVLVLVTDFSTLLLDTTDNAVLLPRPVNARTVLLARLVHIGAYLFFLTYSILFFGLVFIAFKFGITAFVICVVLALFQAFISLFLTTLLYMLLIRFASEERVKDIVSYFQIVLTLLVTFGYQMISRILDWKNILLLKVEVSWWHYLIPSFWMSGTVEWIKSQQFTMLPFALLAVFVPLLSFWFLNRYLAPFFNQYIANLGVGDSGASEKLIVQKRRTLATILAERFTRNNVEKAAFELSWKITSRDRRFKMRTYPSFGSVLPLVFLTFKDAFNSDSSLDTSSKIYLIIIYFAIIILQSFHSQTYFSDDYKAAGVYFTTPHTTPRDILLGNLKVIVLKYFMPFYLLIATAVTAVWGYQVIDDLVLCYLLSLVSAMIEVVVSSRFFLPFAKSPATMKEVNQTSQIMLLLFLLPIFALLHWGLTYLPYGVIGGCIVAAFLVYVLYKRYDKISWHQFEL